MTTNRLLERWRNGEAAIGAWSVMGSPLGAELMAVSGYDYVGIDCQHGLTGYDGMLPVLHAISRCDGVTPLARVSWNDPAEIGKVLDAGAEGVIVPMVDSAEDAARAAAACRYAPTGVRSFGPVRASLFLGGDPDVVNNQIACIVMIETIAGVEVADEICSTPGIDGVDIGPADLAVSMGIPLAQAGSSQEITDVIERVRLACDKAGIVAGIHTGRPNVARDYLDQGFKMVTLSTDAMFLRTAATSALTTLRGEGPTGARDGYS